MANENAKIDANYKKTLLGVTDDSNAELKRLLVDATTGRLKVSASATYNTYVYIGEQDTVGSWRIGRDGSNNLLFQYYNGASWVDAFSIDIPT